MSSVGIIAFVCLLFGTSPDAPLGADDMPPKAVDPMDPFVVFGKVTDEAGKPLEGVEVYASCGMGSLRVTGKTKTDAAGKYRLPFTGGIMVGGTGGKWGVGTQVATITPVLKGWYETHLHRRGNLMMSEWKEKLKPEDYKGYAGVVDMNEPYELNFTMTKAATIRGRFVNDFGSPIEGQKIYLAGDILPPSCGVLASATTDKDGRFEFDSVPIWFAEPSTHLKWRFSLQIFGVRHELETDAFEVAIAHPQAKPTMQELILKSDADGKSVRLTLQRKVLPAKK